MQFLNNNMTKIGLLVSLALVGIYMLKQNEKKLSKDVVNVLIAVVCLGVLYLGFQLMDNETESFVDDVSLTDTTVETVSDFDEPEPDHKFKKTLMNMFLKL